jgi:hypothetical protein
LFELRRYFLVFYDILLKQGSDKQLAKLLLQCPVCLFGRGMWSSEIQAAVLSHQLFDKRKLSLLEPDLHR